MFIRKLSCLHSAKIGKWAESPVRQLVPRHFRIILSVDALEHAVPAGSPRQGCPPVVAVSGGVLNVQAEARVAPGGDGAVGADSPLLPPGCTSFCLRHSAFSQTAFAKLPWRHTAFGTYCLFAIWHLGQTVFATNYILVNLSSVHIAFEVGKINFLNTKNKKKPNNPTYVGILKVA